MAHAQPGGTRAVQGKQLPAGLLGAVPLGVELEVSLPGIDRRETIRHRLKAASPEIGGLQILRVAVQGTPGVLCRIGDASELELRRGQAGEDGGALRLQPRRLFEQFPRGLGFSLLPPGGCDTLEGFGGTRLISARTDLRHRCSPEDAQRVRTVQ